MNKEEKKILKDKEDSIERLEKILKNERLYWYKRILNLSRDSRDVDKIADGQVKMLTYRHQINDKISDIRNSINKKRESIKKKRRSTFLEYKTQGYQGYRPQNKEEFAIFIEADMVLDQRMVDMLESQIEQYYQTINTLDKLGFVYKNIIELTLRVIPEY